MRAVVIDAGAYDWEGDAPLDAARGDRRLRAARPRLHVATSASRTGTFAGLIEKIPYLGARRHRGRAAAGVPVRPDRRRLLGLQPDRPSRRTTATERSTSSATWSRRSTTPGIEVILDVVFNHTGEGDDRGPTISFRGLDNEVYYMLPHGPSVLPELLRLRQHRQLQPPDRPRTHPRLPALLGRRDARRRLPLRPGLVLARDPDGAADGRPAGRREIELEDELWRHEADRRAVGRRRALPGRQLPRPALVGVERPLPRRRAPLLARRRRHGRRARHAPRRQRRPLPAVAPAAARERQLRHLPRRLHA